MDSLELISKMNHIKALQVKWKINITKETYQLEIVW